VRTERVKRRRRRRRGGREGALRDGDSAFTGTNPDPSVLCSAWAGTGRLYLAGVAMCPESETYILLRAHVNEQTDYSFNPLKIS